MSFCFGDLDRAYDVWKTTPPDEEVSKVICDGCDSYIYPDEKVYEIDGCRFCEDCARDWLEQQAHSVTYEEAEGE